MPDNRSTETVNIRPGVSILSVLRHLNYRPWFAMAEFVDNSIQSSKDYLAELTVREGPEYKLKVSIEIDPVDRSVIYIRDNAAGIHEKDYARAFRPAQIPPDRSGLAEFGMGMKSAACWFAPKWTVRTTALGESKLREVTFNIQQIIEDDIDELVVVTKPAASDSHFTEIALRNLHKPLHGITVNKIKEHLSSIYRYFLRDGSIQLFFNGDKLSSPMPRILTAPYYRTLQSPPIVWRKDISFDFGDDLKIQGFAALRETASTTHAGFALFRRNRLIEGSGDETYRPEYIFGKPNSFRYQRVFGELHLEGFEVSHTKDGFRWDENEQPFLELLKDHLDSAPIPILQQAEEYRAKSNPAQLRKAAENANERTSKTVEKDAPEVLQPQLTKPPQSDPLPTTLLSAELASKREFDLEFANFNWHISLELSLDPAIGEWVEIGDYMPASSANACRTVAIRMALSHPFMERFSGSDSSHIEGLLRVAVGICLGEIAARDSGVKQAGTIRRNLNELLMNALCNP